MSLEVIKKEITKFFGENIVPDNHQRLEIANDSDKTKMTIFESESTGCKWICVILPKETEILPFKVDEEKYYVIFKYKKNCEAAALISINEKIYLVLFELKSTLRLEKLEDIKLKITSSLYLLLAVLRFIKFEPKNFLAIVGFMRDKLLFEPTDFDMNKMDEKQRGLYKEWKSGFFVVNDVYGSKIKIRIVRGSCHSDVDLQSCLSP